MPIPTIGTTDVDDWLDLLIASVLIIGILSLPILAEFGVISW
jgi:hypothetical protein